MMEDENINSACKQKKVPKKKLVKQQVISYNLFVLENKSRFKALYPFLSNDQINKKMKALWDLMGQEEKRHYCKTTLRSTPVKMEKQKKRDIRKRKLEVTIRTTSNAKKSKASQMDKKGESFSIYDDEDNKLSNSNTVSLSEYTNDFRLSQSPSVSPNTKSPRSWNKHEVGQGSWKMGYKTYMNTKFRPEFGSSIPEVVHETPVKQVGILKPKCESSSKKTRGRVSFSAKPSKKSSITPPCSSPTEYDQFDDQLEDSDDEFPVLMRREDINQDGVCCSGTDEPPVKRAHKEVDCIDDDDEHDALLIRREDDFEEIDQHKMAVDEEDDSPEDTENCTNKDTARVGEEVQSLTEECNKLNKEQSLERSSGKKRKGSKRGRLIKSREKEKGICGKGDEAVDTADGQMEMDSSQEKDPFKSPLPSEKRKRRRKRNSDNDGTNEKENERSKETPKSGTTLSKLTNETPVMQSVGGDGDKYTTPQMDEAMQQLTLQEVVKAPHKRRSAQSGIHCGNVVEGYKDSAAHKKVTRALMTKTGDSFTDCNTSCASIDEKGDSKKDKVNVQTKNSNKAKRLESDCTKDVKPVPVKRQETDFRKPARRSRRHGNQGGESYISDFVCDSEKESKELTDSSEAKGILGELKKIQTSVKYSSIVAESPDMLDLCSSPASVTDDLAVTGWKDNPVLTKALEKIRSTVRGGPGSPTLSINSAGSSPRLLSPALSGVSELSSVSSSIEEFDRPVSNSRMRKVQTGKRSNVTQPTEANVFPHSKARVAEDINERRELCEMFQDITPPEKKKKTKGNSRRMVASATTEGESNFSSLFKDDEIFY